MRSYPTENKNGCVIRTRTWFTRLRALQNRGNGESEREGGVIPVCDGVGPHGRTRVTRHPGCHGRVGVQRLFFLPPAWVLAVSTRGRLGSPVTCVSLRTFVAEPQAARSLFVFERAWNIPHATRFPMFEYIFTMVNVLYDPHVWGYCGSSWFYSYGPVIFDYSFLSWVWLWAAVL